MQGKVKPEPNAQTRVYVGIDTCKAWLDVYVHPIGLAFRVPNSYEGLKQLKRRLTGLVVVLIVMEATGKLHREAYRNLTDSGHAVAVVNPLRSRLFAEALGQLAKTDKVDARMLALMGAMLEPKAKPPAPETIETFQEASCAAARPSCNSAPRSSTSWEMPRPPSSSSRSGARSG